MNELSNRIVCHLQREVERCEGTSSSMEYFKGDRYLEVTSRILYMWTHLQISKADLREHLVELMDSFSLNNSDELQRYELSSIVELDNSKTVLDKFDAELDAVCRKSPPNTKSKSPVADYFGGSTHRESTAEAFDSSITSPVLQKKSSMSSLSKQSSNRKVLDKVKNIFSKSSSKPDASSNRSSLPNETVSNVGTAAMCSQSAAALANSCTVSATQTQTASKAASTSASIPVLKPPHLVEGSISSDPYPTNKTPINNNRSTMKYSILKGKKNLIPASDSPDAEHSTNEINNHLTSLNNNSSHHQELFSNAIEKFNSPSPPCSIVSQIFGSNEYVSSDCNGTFEHEITSRSPPHAVAEIEKANYYTNEMPVNLETLEETGITLRNNHQLAQMNFNALLHNKQHMTVHPSESSASAANSSMDLHLRNQLAMPGTSIAISVGNSSKKVLDNNSNSGIQYMNQIDHSSNAAYPYNQIKSVKPIFPTEAASKISSSNARETYISNGNEGGFLKKTNSSASSRVSSSSARKNKTESHSNLSENKNSDNNQFQNVLSRFNSFRSSAVADGMHPGGAVSLPLTPSQTISEDMNSIVLKQLNNSSLSSMVRKLSINSSVYQVNQPSNQGLLGEKSIWNGHHHQHNHQTNFNSAFQSKSQKAASNSCSSSSSTPFSISQSMLQQQQLGQQYNMSSLNNSIKTSHDVATRSISSSIGFDALKTEGLQHPESWREHRIDQDAQYHQSSNDATFNSKAPLKQTNIVQSVVHRSSSPSNIINMKHGQALHEEQLLYIGKNNPNNLNYIRSINHDANNIRRCSSRSSSSSYSQVENNGGMASKPPSVPILLQNQNQGFLSSSISESRNHSTVVYEQSAKLLSLEVLQDQLRLSKEILKQTSSPSIPASSSMDHQGINYSQLPLTSKFTLGNSADHSLSNSTHNPISRLDQNALLTQNSISSSISSASQLQHSHLLSTSATNNNNQSEQFARPGSVPIVRPPLADQSMVSSSIIMPQVRTSNQRHHTATENSSSAQSYPHHLSEVDNLNRKAPSNYKLSQQTATSNRSPMVPRSDNIASSSPSMQRASNSQSSGGMTSFFGGLMQAVKETFDNIMDPSLHPSNQVISPNLTFKSRHPQPQQPYSYQQQHTPGFAMSNGQFQSSIMNNNRCVQPLSPPLMTPRLQPNSNKFPSYQQQQQQQHALTQSSSRGVNNNSSKNHPTTNEMLKLRRPLNGSGPPANPGSHMSPYPPARRNPHEQVDGDGMIGSFHEESFNSKQQNQAAASSNFQFNSGHDGRQNMTYNSMKQPHTFLQKIDSNVSVATAPDIEAIHSEARQYIDSTISSHAISTSLNNHPPDEFRALPYKNSIIGGERAKEKISDGPTGEKDVFSINNSPNRLTGARLVVGFDSSKK